jgi:hypothetical protein
MNRSLLAAFAVTLTLGAAVSTAASGATLDVQTGLWEVASTGETTGLPPIPPEALARMSAEQRAQMQAHMAAAMERSNKPDVRRSCITAKTLQRGLDFSQGERPNCKRTVLSSSSSQIDVRIDCTGDEKMNGNFHFEAVDRQTMRGTINLVISNGANKMTMNRTMQGKWLGSDCGSVKPYEE